MPKGPRVHPDIEKEIAMLIWRNPLLTGKEVQGKLESKFKGTDITIPSERTIYDRTQRIRTQLTIQEKPWSLALMKKSEEGIGIPWEAVGFIMKSLVDLQSMVGRSKRRLRKFWPYTFELLTYMERESGQLKKQSKRTILTNRQAKWLWRLHLIFPELKPVDLFSRVDAYVHRELLTDYLGWDFDTSDLDRGLMTLLYHIKHQETPTEKETDEKQIKGKEE